MEDDAASLFCPFARSVRRAIVTDEHRRGLFERPPDDAADGASMVVDRDDHASADLIATEFGLVLSHLEVASCPSVIFASTSGRAHLGVLRVLLASSRSSSHAGDMESGAPANPPSSERRDYRKRIWFSAIIHRLRDRFESLIREHASAGRLGVAVAVGVLIGCTPFLGFQVLLVVAIATLFKLNRIAALLGVQVSTPPITPLLLFANAQVGAVLLHRHWLPISLEYVRGTPRTKWVLDLFLELLAGGLVVGGVLA